MRGQPLSLRGMADRMTSQPIEKREIARRPALTDWVLLVLLGVTWGSSFILIKKGLVAFDAVQVAGLRLLLSGLAFVPVVVWVWRRIDWSRWKDILWVGATGNFFPAFLFAFAQTHLSSSLTGVLSTLTPVFTLLLGVFYFRFLPTRQQVAGVVLGFAGALLLLMMEPNSSWGGQLFFGFLVLLATFFYGLSNNLVKARLQEVPSLIISAVSLAMLAVPAAAALAFTDLAGVFQTHPHALASLGYVSILALGGTVVATVLFFRLVQRTTPVFASMVSYIIPLVAVLWGLLDGEYFGWHHLLGMVLILWGVYLARR